MRFVTKQPRKTKDKLEVAERHDMGGKGFDMTAMNAKALCIVVCDRTSRRLTAVNKLEGDGMGLQNRLELMRNQDGGVQEAI